MARVEMCLNNIYNYTDMLEKHITQQYQTQLKSKQDILNATNKQYLRKWMDACINSDTKTIKQLTLQKRQELNLQVSQINAFVSKFDTTRETTNKNNQEIKKVPDPTKSIQKSTGPKSNLLKSMIGYFKKQDSSNATQMIFPDKQVKSYFDKAKGRYVFEGDQQQDEAPPPPPPKKQEVIQRKSNIQESKPKSQLESLTAPPVYMRGKKKGAKKENINIPMIPEILIQKQMDFAEFKRRLKQQLVNLPVESNSVNGVSKDIEGIYQTLRQSQDLTLEVNTLLKLSYQLQLETQLPNVNYEQTTDLQQRLQDKQLKCRQIQKQLNQLQRQRSKQTQILRNQLDSKYRLTVDLQKQLKSSDAELIQKQRYLGQSQQQVLRLKQFLKDEQDKSDQSKVQYDFKLNQRDSQHKRLIQAQIQLKRYLSTLLLCDNQIQIADICMDDERNLKQRLQECELNNVESQDTKQIQQIIKLILQKSDGKFSLLQEKYNNLLELVTAQAKKYESQSTKYEHKITNLTKQLFTARSTLQNYSQQNASILNSIQEYTDLNKRIAKELQISKHDYLYQNQLLEQSNKKIGLVNAKLQQALSDCEKLKNDKMLNDADKKLLKKERNQLRSEIDLIKSEKQILEAQLQKLRERISLIENEKELLKHNVAEKEKQLRNTDHHINHIISEHNKQIYKTQLIISDKTVQLQKSIQKNKYLETQILRKQTELKNQIEKNQHQVAKRTQLESGLEDLKSKMADERTGYLTQIEELKHLRSQEIDNYEQLCATYHQSLLKLKKLQGQIEQKQKLYQQSSVHAQQLRTSLATTVASLETTVAILKQEVQAQCRQIENYAEEIQSKQRQIGIAMDQIKATKHSFENESANLQADISKLNDQIRVLRHQIKIRNTQLQNCQHNILTLELTVSQNQTVIARLQQLITQTNQLKHQEITQFQANMLDLENKYLQLNQQFERRTNWYDDRVTGLLNQLDDQRQTQTLLQQRAQELVQSVQSLQSQIKLLNSEHQKSIQHLTQHNSNIQKQYQRQLDQEYQKIAQITQAFNLYKANTEDELLSITQQLHGANQLLQAHHVQHTQQKQGLHLQIETLSNQLQQAIAQYTQKLHKSQSNLVDHQKIWQNQVSILQRQLDSALQDYNAAVLRHQTQLHQNNTHHDRELNQLKMELQHRQTQIDQFEDVLGQRQMAINQLSAQKQAISNHFVRQQQEHEQLKSYYLNQISNFITKMNCLLEKLDNTERQLETEKKQVLTKERLIDQQSAKIQSLSLTISQLADRVKDSESNYDDITKQKQLLLQQIEQNNATIENLQKYVPRKLELTKQNSVEGKPLPPPSGLMSSLSRFFLTEKEQQALQS